MPWTRTKICCSQSLGLGNSLVTSHQKLLSWAMSSRSFGSQSCTEKPCVGRKRNSITLASTQSMRTTQMCYTARYLLSQPCGKSRDMYVLITFFVATKRISSFYPRHLRLSFCFTQQTQTTESIFEISSILHLIP